MFVVWLLVVALPVWGACVMCLFVWFFSGGEDAGFCNVAVVCVLLLFVLV